jgi:phosphatidylserine/phosphatidylglycerophosphate/cardiolipin synthase-like enzyme
MHAVESARRSIWITQLAFDADCETYDSRGGARSLAGALLAAVARGPIEIRIVLNETFLLDTARPLRRFFAERLGARPAVPGTIEIRGVSSFPRLQHAKMVIVDRREALLLGSPFVNGYWDDQRHQPLDARRPRRELGGRPLHDLAIALRGAPVAELEHLFTELWTPDAPLAPVSAARTDVRVVSTSPRGVLRHRPRGATEILGSLLEGIAAARSLIYIEHQYLCARPIVAALADALRREPRLEIVAVLNENADVTAYRRWQNARLEESGLLAHPRVGLFALWSAARGTHRTQLNQVFVHSKVVTVDDAWASAGSANLDGVSLHSYGDDFTGIGRRMFRHTRNFDVNVVVDGRLACDLRTRLWGEHLGSPCCSLVERPAAGWLPLWRARAQANVAALNDLQSRRSDTVMQGRVLPYSVESTPARQLAGLGVRVDPDHLEVCFNPGWMEVHFSPNWIWNMFA